MKSFNKTKKPSYYEKLFSTRARKGPIKTTKNIGTKTVKKGKVSQDRKKSEQKLEKPFTPSRATIDLMQEFDHK